MADIPDSLPPFANANPPPNKKIKLQGIFELMYFHVIKLGVAAFGNLSGLLPLQNRNQLQSAGNMNNAITMKIAGVASPIFVFVINSAQPVKNPSCKRRKIFFNYVDFLKFTKCCALLCSINLPGARKKNNATETKNKMAT